MAYIPNPIFSRSTALQGISQTAHGFTLLQPVVSDAATGVYVLSKADASTTASVTGFAVPTGDANTFDLITEGSIAASLVSSLGLAVDTVYYLSSTTAGTWTSTKPTIQNGGYFTTLFRTDHAGNVTIIRGEPIELIPVPPNDYADVPLQKVESIAPGLVGNVAADADRAQVIPFQDLMSLAYNTDTYPSLSVGMVMRCTQIVPSVVWEPQALPSGGGGSMEPYAIPGTTLDLNNVASGGIAWINLAANTTLAVTNAASNEGETYWVAVANPSTYTLSWTGVDFGTGGAPTQSTGGKRDWYVIHVLGGVAVATREITGQTVDTTPPTLVSLVVDSSGTFQATFNEPVTWGTGGVTGWAITASGGALSVTGQSTPSGSGTTTLIMTLSRTVANGETITATYTQPGNGIEDVQGNDFASIGSTGVTNNSPVAYTFRVGYETSQDPPGAPYFVWESGAGAYGGDATAPAPLKGAGSLRLGAANARLIATVTSGSFYEIAYLVNIPASGYDYRAPSIRTSASNYLSGIFFRNGGSIDLICGNVLKTISAASLFGGTGWQTNTTYRVWQRFQRGTGDGTATFWISTGASMDTKPSGNTSTSHTDTDTQAAADAAAARIVVWPNTGSTSNVGILDDLICATASIGNVPP